MIANRLKAYLLNEVISESNGLGFCLQDKFTTQ